MIISHRIASTNYVLEVSVQNLLDIMRKDMDTEKPLYRQLIDIDGVSDIDYDGHFGPHIYLTVSQEHYNTDTWSIIYKTIGNYLTGV